MNKETKREVFRTFDIRGRYPIDLNEDTVAKIGFALGKMLPQSQKVVLGCDFREHSRKLFLPLISGLSAQGKKVYFLEQVPTEMLYFALGFFKFDLGIQITASHCDWEEVGMKISKKGVIPLDVGEIQTLKKEVEKASFVYEGQKPFFEKLDVYSDYAKFVLDNIKNKKIKKKVLLFSFGGSATKIAELINKALAVDFKIVSLSQKELKNNAPNPISSESRNLIKRRAKGKFDLIIGLDGDSDRMIVFDPLTKEMVPSDLTAALLAQSILRQKLGPVVFDCRKRMAFDLVAKEFKVPFFRAKAGYPFIKKEMRRRKAVFGGEVSGHYFYPETFYSESSMLSILKLAGLLSEKKESLKEALLQFRDIYSLPEQNFDLPQSGFEAFSSALQKEFQDADAFFEDGLTLRTKDWYLNIRPSQTEPVIRLNLEARSKSLLKDIFQRVKKIVLESK